MSAPVVAWYCPECGRFYPEPTSCGGPHRVRRKDGSLSNVRPRYTFINCIRGTWAPDDEDAS